MILDSINELWAILNPKINKMHNFKDQSIKIVLLILFAANLNAQAPDWSWAKKMGGKGSDGNPISIVIDSSLNILTAGSFNAINVNFDPGNGIAYLNSSGMEDIFISKLDANGNYIWAKKIGGISRDVANSIATDLDGNIYITGIFDDTVDFDPGIGIYNMVASGFNDAFVCKLDSSGNFVWSIAMGGPYAPFGNDIALDSFGNVFITGWGIYLAKISSSGILIFNYSMSPAFGAGYSVAIDQMNNIVVEGFYNSTVDFDPSVNNYYLSLTGTFPNEYLCKFDNTGNFLWAKSFTVKTRNCPIAIDNFNNIITTGSFKNTVDFDPGTSVFNLTSADSSDDVFICKLDLNGNFIWAKCFGDTSSDIGTCIKIDSANDIYVIGTFQNTVDFDPGINTYYQTSIGGDDIFISKINESGNFIWGKSAGGSFQDRGTSIAFGANEDLYATGNFKSYSILFGQTTLLNSDITSAGSDIFIAKLSSYTGLSESEIHNSIVISPNPCQDQCTITTLNNRNLNYIIYDLEGRIVLTGIFTNRLTIDVSHLESGLYFVKTFTCLNIGAVCKLMKH